MSTGSTSDTDELLHDLEGHWLREERVKSDPRSPARGMATIAVDELDFTSEEGSGCSPGSSNSSSGGSSSSSKELRPTRRRRVTQGRRRGRGGGAGGGGGSAAAGGAAGDDGGEGISEGKHGQRNAANARERARMRVLSKAFSRLKTTLPWVPADTKLSKLDTLRLASSYIGHLRQILADETYQNGFVHPVNLTWPFLAAAKGDSELKDGGATSRMCASPVSSLA
uniref:Transcription factor 21-like n=1 Tax=Petromyzon marinus TaxID=7757 RepID=A0AAJ7T3X1_PETMA|nr:transcription factor 21-like [Petromyzon marinus]